MAMNQKGRGGATTGHKENSRSHTGNQHNPGDKSKVQGGSRSSESSSQNLSGRDMRTKQKQRKDG